MAQRSARRLAGLKEENRFRRFSYKSRVMQAVGRIYLQHLQADFIQHFHHLIERAIAILQNQKDALCEGTAKWQSHQG